MKKIIFNLKVVLVFFLVVSLALTGGLVLQQHRSKTRLAIAAGENIASLQQRYAQAGKIMDRHGEILAYSENGTRYYHQNQSVSQSVLHVVGDYTQRIGNTIETVYQNTLLGNDRGFLRQLWLDLNGKGLVGDDITLTLDASLTQKAHTLLLGEAGSVVMINYKTGEIIIATSTPSIQPQQVIDYVDIPDTALFNRSFAGAYAPGSIFKLVTTLSWLKSEQYDPDFTLICDGTSNHGSGFAHENGQGHGQVNLAKAAALSCNIFFAELGLRLGREELIARAQELGIGTAFKIDNLTTYKSNISCPDDPIQLTWLAVGQPTGEAELAMSPLEITRLSGAIANQGVLMSSHIISHINDPKGDAYSQTKPVEESTILDRRTAAVLEELMLLVVAEGSGSNAALSGYQVAGKTGTVQVEGQANNALFTGYIKDDLYPYAITVIIEGGGSGGEKAASAAAQILQASIQGL